MVHEHEPVDGERLTARSPTGRIIVALVVLIVLAVLGSRFLHLSPPELAKPALIDGRSLGVNSKAHLSFAIRKRFPVFSDASALRWTLWWQGFTVETGSSSRLFRAYYDWSAGGCGARMTVTWSVDDRDRIASLEADAQRGPVCS